MHKEQVEAVVESIIERHFGKVEDIAFLKQVISKSNVDFTHSTNVKMIKLNKNGGFDMEQYRSGLLEETIFEALFTQYSHMAIMITKQRDAIRQLAETSAKAIEALNARIEALEHKCRTK